MLGRTVVWASVLFVALALACDDGAQTAILVRLEAPATLLASADTLRVRVYDTDRQLVRDVSARLADHGGTLALPASVPIFPGGDLPRSYYLEADLLADDAPIARQRLTGGFRDGVAVVIPIAFDDGCGVSDCNGLETCVGGRCVGACYDAERLVSESRPTPLACEQVAFVDPDDGADGDEDCFSPATPCASVAHAQSFLEDARGGRVLLRGSMMHRGFRITVSGAPGAPLVFRPWPGTGVPIVDGTTQGTSADGTIFTCCGETSPSHLVIEDLEVQDALGAGVYLHGTACTDVTIRGLEVHGTRGPTPEQHHYSMTTAGIVVTNEVSNIVIEHNWVHDNRGHGPVEDSTLDGDVSGITSSNTPGPVVITDNLIENNAGMGAFVQGATMVVRNVIRMNGADGIAGLPIGIPVENNIVCASGGAGIRVVSSDDLRIRHNMILASMGPGLLVTGWAARNVVEDNVFAFGADVGIGWVSETSSSGTIEPVGASEPLDDNNFLFANARGDYRDIIEPGANNRLEDPGIEGVSDCSVQLAPGSPLRGAATDGTDIGADLALLADVLSLARSTP